MYICHLCVSFEVQSHFEVIFSTRLGTVYICHLCIGFKVQNHFEVIFSSIWYVLYGTYWLDTRGICTCAKFPFYTHKVLFLTFWFKTEVLNSYFKVSKKRRQRSRMVWAPDLKSVDLEFKSRPDHQLNLFQVVPGSTPLLRLYIPNWSASCQLGFLSC